MKRILIIGILCSLFTFGCKDISTVKINPTGWNHDESRIIIDSKYKYKDFKKDLKDNKCIVTITYEENKKD